MDMNLHSFILAIGVIVIGFIVIDGIKKVRAARANQRNQALDSYDSLDALSENEELPIFDDLEIKDEILQQALNDELGESFDSLVLDVEPPVQKTTPNPLQGNNAHASKPSKPLFDVLVEDIAPALNQSSDAVNQESTGQAAQTTDDQFEHFTAHDDELTPSDNDQITAKRNQASATIEPNSASDEIGKAPPVLVESVQSMPSASKRISKAALAKQLAQVKRDAKAHANQTAATLSQEMVLDDKEQVPVLMEPVELGQKVDPNPPTQHELVLPEFIQQTLQDEPIYDVEKAQERPNAKADLLMEYIDDVQALAVGEKLSEREAAKEIFVINILKQDGKGLSGQALQDVFKACDMRHGEMNIYHRFEQANAQGKIQFSVVNAIEPGTFDVNNMNALMTPGITLFMSLPGPDKPMDAFDAMAEVALVFARNFDATLHDDTHSGLTPQTLEHYRNRVREFSRKHLSHKK